VKFFISMKAIKKAMDPPTQEAMIMVSVLSTTLTEKSIQRRRQKERENEKRSGYFNNDLEM